MPAEELMGWNKTQRRWYKRYRGRLYFVSPRQLDTEATKDASRSAANRWWGKKQAEIDEQLGKTKQHPAKVVDQYETAIANFKAYARWHRRHDGDIQEAEQAENIAHWLSELLSTDDPPYPLTREQFDPLTKYSQDYALWCVWIERMKRQRAEERAEQAVPPENTIRGHIDEYLATVKIQAQAKGKLGKHSDVKYRLGLFRKWVDPTAPIENLNEITWERFNLWLAQQVADQQLSPATMLGVQVAVRTFVRNRWERRFIELPRNLNNRALSASVPLPIILLFSVDEVKQILAASSERKRLYWLLALNCGMYPVDIAKLRQDEVDWEHGRIARKRTKTRNRSENVPRVDYLLWRETFTLLKKYRSNHPELALLNRNGSPLWNEREKNGKFDRNSNIKTAWFQLMQQLKWEDKPPLKSLRKTSASMLENHPEYGRYAEHFLGEAPHAVASRHYIKPSREQFDSAITWLGEQFTITPALGSSSTRRPTHAPLARPATDNP